MTLMIMMAVVGCAILSNALLVISTRWSIAQDTTVKKLFNRVRQWYLEPESRSCSGLSVSHWACVRVIHEVTRHCPELIYTHAAVVLPLIFVNQQVSRASIHQRVALVTVSVVIDQVVDRSLVYDK